MDYHKVSLEIFNATADSLAKLAVLFPATVKDGQLDIAALREELGQFEEVGAERYELTWAGKQAAKKLSQTDVPGRTLKYVPEDSKDADTTQNLYIEGDNLEVLKLLRQNYYGSVNMIYIDPPYNTGTDRFLYRDNFHQIKTDSDAAEGEIVNGERMIVNQKSYNRYHSTWLSELYPVLRVAKDLLCNNGIVLINMDEHEITNLQKLCGEIFGDDNDLGTIVWDKRNPKGDAKGVSYQHEYIVCFAKNKSTFLESCKMLRPKRNAEAMLKKADQIFKKVNRSFSLEEANKEFQVWIASQKDLSGGEAAYKFIDSNGDVYRPVSMAWPNKQKAPDDYFIPLIHPITGKPCPLPERGWRNPSATMKELLAAELILFGRDETTQPNRKYLLKENMSENIPSLLYYGGSDTDLLSELGIPVDTPKVVNIVKEHIQSFTKDDDIVLDFFSGSATVAHAVMQLNAEDLAKRRFIMVQLPENLDVAFEKATGNEKAFIKEAMEFCDSIGKPHYLTEIGKERIRRAGEQIKTENLDIGFKVFRVADTNIRWTHEALKGQLKVDENMLSDKDRLDFMPGYTDIDVVYEILLRQRDIPLSAKIGKLGVGKRTYMFADTYVVCLDDNISNPLVEALASVKPTPIKYVFRDSAFDDNISLKDETIRRLEAYVARNSGKNKKSYTVEFI